MNPMFITDCYKIGHPFMYDQKMHTLESNMTARSDFRFNGTSKYNNKVVAVGFQGLVTEYFKNNFNANFFSRPLDEVIEEYTEMMNGIFGPGVISTEHIAALHKLQKLPIKVQALPEGSLVPMGVPFIRIKNTVKGFGWLTNYLETLVSNYLWPMITNATIAFEFRKVLEAYALETVGEANPFVVGYQAHDFALRGLLGGRDGNVNFGHIVSFIGSDNIPTLAYVKKFYNPQGYIAGSVPATEHSVASSNILNISYQLEKFGKFENTVRDESIPILEQAEQIFITKMITEVFPTGIFSYVTDTFDYWGVLTSILPRIKDVVLSRKETDSPVPTRLVIRPDSGNPLHIIAGYKIYDTDKDPQGLTNTEIADEYDVVLTNGKYYTIEPKYDKWDGFCYGYDLGEEIPKHVAVGSIQTLWDIFGGTVTDKGYRQLDSKIGLIYGDSITMRNLEDILSRLKENGFASTNVIFGVGSFTYQFNTRDTFSMAIKATHGTYFDEDGNDYSVDLYKDPKTGNREKKSAKGLVAVFKDENGFYLVDQATEEDQENDCFVTYFEDGEVISKYTLDDIRNELLSNLPK